MLLLQQRRRRPKCKKSGSEKQPSAVRNREEHEQEAEVALHLLAHFSNLFSPLFLRLAEAVQEQNTTVADPAFLNSEMRGPVHYERPQAASASGRTLGRGAFALPTSFKYVWPILALSTMYRQGLSGHGST